MQGNSNPGFDRSLAGSLSDKGVSRVVSFKSYFEALKEEAVFQIRKKRLEYQFFRRMGYWFDLKNPVTYEEKRQYRKIFGNYPFYGQFADKYKVREYVREMGFEENLVPLLGVFDRLEPGLFRSLPKSFIIKTTHSSKWNRIVHDKEKEDESEIIKYINGFLGKRYSKNCKEYHYDFIKPRVLIEELLFDDGNLPWDYNYFCFHGSKVFFHDLYVASPDHKKKARFRSDWTCFESNLSEEEMAKYADPPNSGRMAEMAQKLSNIFDFARIDLYNIGGKIFFGEITLTPGGVPNPTGNVQRSEMLGRMWKLDRDNRLLYSRKP